MTKKVEVVNFALARLVKQRELEEILVLAGKISWEGHLESMRRNRSIAEHSSLQLK
jgi:hypothetical protein